jgi:hydrogenase maturation protease
MRARVIGIGQPAAGDDGVGIAVLRRLEGRALRDGIELVHAAEPSALIPLLGGVDRVVLVDAVLAGGAPGRVLALTPGDVAASGASLLSTHGVDVTTAIALARATEDTLPEILIVGITIGRAERYRHELTPGVAAAVPAAADLVLRLLEPARTP